MVRDCLRLENLGRSFGEKKVFSGIHLTATRGDVVAVVGPNGAGKTTLLRVLCTLLLPTEGEAWVAGLAVSSSPRAVRERLGWVPASEGGFLPRLTGSENLGLFASLRRIGRRDQDRCLDELGDLGPLRQALETPYYLCSAGMRQTLHLARALLSRPLVLLLDEPTRSLDEETATLMRGFLLRGARDRIVLFSTHRSEDRAYLANREIRLGRES
jgi:ABC-2 type transport system ATP-binding protein